MLKQVDILMIVHSLYEHDSRVRRTVRSLSKFGYSIAVIALWPSQESKGFKEVISHTDGCFLIQAPLKNKSGKSRFMEMMLTANRLANETFKAKIIHCHDLDTLGVGVNLKKKWDATLIYDSHEWYTGSIHVENRWLIKSIWTFLERIWIKNTDYVITVNESIADLFRRAYDIATTSSIVLQNFDELPAFISDPSSDKGWKNENKKALIESFKLKNKTILVYGGYLQRGRGLETAIKTMSEVDSSIGLIIAGEGSLKPQLEMTVEKLDLKPRVLFCGHLYPDDLYRLYQYSDIGLCTIESLAISYHYSLPNKLSQYIQSGLAVIGSDLPEIKKIVENHNCGTVVQNNVSLAAAIAQTTAQLYSFKNASKKASQSLNWLQEENKLKELYAKL